MTNDELLAKEKTLSKKVDELKKELVEKQVALYKFNDYEETSKRIESLKSEIDHFKKSSFVYEDVASLITPKDIFEVSPLLEEFSLRQLGKDKKFLSNVSVLPSININPLTKNTIIANEFAKFMISLRESFIEALEQKLDKIESDIDYACN